MEEFTQRNREGFRIKQIIAAVISVGVIALIIFAFKLGRNASNMNIEFSEPSKNLNILVFGFPDETIDDLMTEIATGGPRWVNRRLRLNQDVSLDPAEPVMGRIPGWLREDLFGPEAGNAPDNFDSIHLIGGDSRGYSFFCSTKRKEYSVDWRSLAPAEVVAHSTDGFLEWLVVNCTMHLEGCPWYLVRDHHRMAVSEIEMWSRRKVDHVRLYHYLTEKLSFSHKYITEQGFVLYDPGMRVEIRLRHDYKEAATALEFAYGENPGHGAELMKILERLPRFGLRENRDW